MDYIEVRTQTTHDAAELLAELLAEITGGAQVDDPQTIEDFVNAPVKRWDYIEEQLFDNPQRDPSVNCYLPPDEEGARMLKEMGELLAQLKSQDESGFYGSLKMEVSQVKSEDWENNWKQYYKPFNVGDRLYVCPSWEQADLPKGRVLLTMDPASSFGTGSHATTRMSSWISSSWMTPTFWMWAAAAAFWPVPLCCWAASTPWHVILKKMPWWSPPKIWLKTTWMPADTPPAAAICWRTKAFERSLLPVVPMT